MRYYQFFGLATIIFGYFFLWKKIAPIPAHNSLIYHQTIKILEKDNRVRQILGDDFIVMNVKGWIWPVMKNVNFEMTLFGDDKA